LKKKNEIYFNKKNIVFNFSMLQIGLKA